MVGKGRHFVGLLVKDRHFVFDFASHAFIPGFTEDCRLVVSKAEMLIRTSLFI